MRTIVVLLSFVLLLHAGSDAKPIFPSRAGPPADSSSSPSLSESPLSADQLAVKEYKDQQLEKYTDSTLIHLFDEHDVVPEEHEYWGSDCPFNICEYFTFKSLGETKGKGWKKIWEGIQSLFPSGNKITNGDLDAEVVTTDGTDGSANGDKVSPFAFPKKKKGNSLGRYYGSGKRVWR